MRKGLSIIVSALLLSSFAQAAEDKDKVIEMLIQRLDKVEGELAQFKKSTKTQIDELHIRSDETELSSALSKVKFSLGFETDVHSFGGDGQDSSNKWTNTLHLNMDAKINDKTRFTGRLAMSKNWADSTLGTPTDDVAGRSTLGGSSVYVDRAYVDYYMTENLIATLGRQPGTDGPGANLRNNAKRQSTYPSMLFSANGDGLILTYKPKIDGLADSALRVGYAKAYQWDSTASATNNNISGDSLIDDAQIWLAIAETKLPLGDMGDNLIMLSAVSAPDFNVPAGSPLGNLNVGDLTFANLYFENNNAFGSNFSWFGSLGYSKGSNAKDNSAAINSAIYASAYAQSFGALSVTNPFGGAANVTTATTVANGAVAANAPSAIAATRLNEEDGWAIHLGGRYDFNKEWKLGYEYFHGSKYWYSLTTRSASDPLGKLRTRGDVHDLYAIYQLDMNQFLRLSWTRFMYDYSGSGQPVGPVTSLDDEVDHFMLTYNVRF
jgi:hypothetical protein